MAVLVGVFFLVIVIVAAAVAVSVLLVRGAGVNVELHALDVLPLRAVVVHVKVSEVELAEFPLERARPHAEVNESADHHVAANSGNAVQVESFHCKVSGGRSGSVAQVRL